MKAMILAAGLGTRLRPYTNHYAKPALPFLNTPLLYYAVALLEKAGATQFVINAHYKPEQIIELSKNIPGVRTRTIVSVEDEKPLGSGGGVWQARVHLQDEEDFLLANGDEVLFPSKSDALQLMVDQHLGDEAFATIYVMEHQDVGTKFGGVWADGNGRVFGFGKQNPRPDLKLRAFHYVGVQILSNGIFDYLPEGESNLLYDAMTDAINDGQEVCIYVDQCKWFETGNPHDFLLATKDCVLNELHSEDKFLREILSRFWLNGSADLENQIKGQSLIGRNVKVERGVQLSGFAVIGDNVVLGAGCEVKNSVVLPGAVIAPDTLVENQIVLPAI